MPKFACIYGTDILQKLRVIFQKSPCNLFVIYDIIYVEIYASKNTRQNRKEWKNENFFIGCEEK